MTQAPAQSESAPLLFGRYRVREQLGEGRLATVYHATDERLQRPVLVHLLRKDLAGQEPLRQRFREEIAASARRSHPALLELFDSGEVAGRPFMVTEYVAGRPLRALGVLAIEDALLYLRQVTSAVMVCQAAGVAYPPISSSNVMLVDEGRVKLVESWRVRPEEVPLDLAAYRPPERTRGDGPSPANVVYSLGLLLYELASGRRAISGDDARAVAQAHLSARISPLAHARPTLYLPSLQQLIDRATARDPAQRLPDAAAFSDALDALRRDIGSDTRPLAPPPPRRRSRLQPPDAEAAEAAQRPRRGLTLFSMRAEEVASALPEREPGLSGAIRRQSARRSVTGWVVALVLLLLVAYGSYVGASFLVDQFFSVRLPAIGLPGSFGGKALVVNIEDLNLRDGAGVNTTVMRTVPLGTRVEQLEGPVDVDGVPWVRVRGEAGGEAFEGWMSLKYLREE
jgi:serine/threonine protein kinase